MWYTLQEALEIQSHVISTILSRQKMYKDFRSVLMLTAARNSYHRNIQVPKA